MTKLFVHLKFACPECEDWNHLQVHCSGKGLVAGPRAVAAVKIACPTCGEINEVCFNPTGTVVAVRSSMTTTCLPVPSTN